MELRVRSHAAALRALDVEQAIAGRVTRIEEKSLRRGPSSAKALPAPPGNGRRTLLVGGVEATRFALVTQERKGRPDAAPKGGGTRPSSRVATARTCACSLEAQGPPDAAPKSGGTRPYSSDSAAITCACSSKAGRDHPSALYRGFGLSSRFQKFEDALSKISTCARVHGLHRGEFGTD
jgi:hypothetical protein